MSATSPNPHLGSLVTRAVLASVGITVVAVFSLFELTVLGGYLDRFGEVLAGERSPEQNVADVRQLFVTELYLNVFGGTAWVLSALIFGAFVLAARRAYGSLGAVVAALRQRPDSLLALAWSVTLVASLATEAIGDQLMRIADAPDEFVVGARLSSAGNSLALVAALLAVVLIVRIVARARRGVDRG